MRAFQESLELMTEPPYLLQLFPLLRQIAKARLFYKKHYDSFVQLNKLVAMAVPMEDLTVMQLLGEYQRIENNIQGQAMKLARRKVLNLTFDEGFALYLITRAFRPGTIFETGVANGLSTRIILEAIVMNRRGILVSTEIEKDVGPLVPDSLRKHWQLHVGEPSSVLTETLEEVGQVDLFLHDSDHSYENMLFEFKKAYHRMSPHGLMVSDDVDTNPAFIEFAASIGRQPSFVYSFRKILGIIRL